MSEKFVAVVLPLPLRHPLIYRLPPEMATRMASLSGRRVVVPLGSRRLAGCILNENKDRPEFPTKEILSLPDEGPILSPATIRLLHWASAYYLTPIGEVFRHLVPPGILRQGPIPPLNIPALPLYKGREGKGIQRHPLNAGQQQALEAILEENRKERPSPILLQGITGSGKTEVYIEVVRHIIKERGQALVLVPEIGLTPQLVDRFQPDLASQVLVSHSDLTPLERLQVWLAVKEGKAPVVISTRSGIFLPFPDLKVIVVDEEHDSSFKQEERFCYHARDLALWRGAEEKFPVLLGSATPSLEVRYRIQKQKMRRLELTSRASGTTLPAIEMIDRRNHPAGGWKHSFLSERLLEEIEVNLKKREQSLLFLNRRGYSPFLICTGCGNVPQCSDCDISLTLHRGNGDQLICHYCDATRTCPAACPKCRRQTMKAEGFGCERIDSELRSLFPGARIARLDRDTVRKKGWFEILEKMKRREIDILIGTQMVTKGHDYPEVTLVGILDADLSRNLPDFRAAERTWQLVTQVAGRAGRGEKKGRVLIQTYQPQESSLLAAAEADGERFCARELRQREEAGYPPFRRLIEIRLAAKKRERLSEKCRTLAGQIRKTIPKAEAILLGPAPCPIEKVRGRLYWRLLLKTASYARIQPRLRRLVDNFAESELPSNMKMLVNVDPVNMM